jgi:hypothetical protein
MTTRRKGGQRRGFANAEKALKTARNARHEAKLNEFRGVMESVQGSRPGPITSNNTGPKMNTGLGFLQFLGPENLARLSRVNRGFRNMVKQTFHFQKFTLKPGQTLVQLYKSFPGALNIDLSERGNIKDQEFLEAMPLGFKNVRILDMGYCRKITDVGLAPLTNLTSLNMQGCEQITDDRLKLLTNLTSLHMFKCHQITDAGLAPLTNLTSLNMNYCEQITPAAFTTLDKLEICYTTGCTPVVKEAAEAKIAENKARKSVSNMEALDGGTRRRRFKKSKQSKKTRRL